MPLTLKQAADWLNVDPATLRQQIAKGKLKARKNGRDWFVTPGEVRRYDAAREAYGSPAVVEQDDNEEQAS